MVEVVFCGTKKDKGDVVEVRTKLTIDFKLLSEKDVIRMAVASAVIKWQNNARAAAGPIPTEATYVVPVPGTRSTTFVSPTEMLVRIFGAERAALIIEKSGSAEAALETLKHLF